MSIWKRTTPPPPPRSEALLIAALRYLLGERARPTANTGTTIRLSKEKR